MVGARAARVAQRGVGTPFRTRLRLTLRQANPWLSRVKPWQGDCGGVLTRPPPGPQAQPSLLLLRERPFPHTLAAGTLGTYSACRPISPRLENGVVRRAAGDFPERTESRLCASASISGNQHRRHIQHPWTQKKAPGSQTCPPPSLPRGPPPGQATGPHAPPPPSRPSVSSLPSSPAGYPRRQPCRSPAPRELHPLLASGPSLGPCKSSLSVQRRSAAAVLTSITARGPLCPFPSAPGAQNQLRGRRG